MSSVTRASIGVSKGRSIAYESPDQGEALRSTARDELRRRMLAAGDGVAVAAASATLIFAPSGGIEVAFWTLTTVPVWILLAKLHGLYGLDERALRHLTVDEIPLLFGWALASTGATILALHLTPVESLHPLAAIVLCAAVATVAFVIRAVVRFSWRRLTPPERALVVGDGPLAEALGRKIDLFPDIHIELAKRVRNLAELAARPERLSDIECLIVASGEVNSTALDDFFGHCDPRGIRLVTVLPPARSFSSGARLHHIADLPVVTYEAGDRSRVSSAFKRGLDVMVALAALVLLFPLMIAIGIAVRLGSPGPAVFAQPRVGLAGRRFRMLKFRTMLRNESPETGTLVSSKRDLRVKVLPDDPRITRVGRFLRRTSLDELPQLWNVIRGDMSLVGPRPELVELVARWPSEHRIRLSVKPGLTGPMQVYGRSDLTSDEWLAVEREYIENPSIWRDLRILALTLPVAWTGRGAF